MPSIAPSPASFKVLDAIRAALEAAPRSHFEMLWCDLPRAALAQKAGVSVKTVSRALKTQEIDYCVIRPGTRKILLTRPTGKRSDDYVVFIRARTMSKLFRSRTGKGVGRAGFGLLTGLAKCWGADCLAVLNFVLDNWPGLATQMQVIGRDYVNSDGSVSPDLALLYPGHDWSKFDAGWTNKFHTYPALAEMRLFHWLLLAHYTESQLTESQ